MSGVAYAGADVSGLGRQPVQPLHDQPDDRSGDVHRHDRRPGKVLGLAVVPVSGVSQSGAPGPGCHGPLGLGVNSTATPGNAAFALTVFGAPPSAAGILFATSALLPVPRIKNGVMILVDVAASDAEVSWWSGRHGGRPPRVPDPGDPTLVGATRFAQVGFQDACAPGGIVVSPALAVTVMP